MKNNIEKEVAISIKLPVSLRDKANEQSRKTLISVSDYIRRSLQNWVTEIEKVVFYLPDEKAFEEVKKFLNNPNIAYGNLHTTTNEPIKKDEFICLEVEFIKPVSPEWMEIQLEMMQRNRIKISDWKRLK